MNAHPTTILICDDAEPIRHLHRMVFDDEPDFEVVGEVCDGHECIEAVLSLQPDVVLLDITMPRLDGIGALPGIRAACERTCVVVCSSDADEWTRTRALSLGAADYLPKGMPTHELVDRVRAAARR